MLDIAHQTPGEMQDYDESSTKSPEDLGGRIQRHWQLTLQLDEWKVDMDLTCIPMAYRTRVATWHMSFAEAIEFEDLAVVVPFTSSYGVRMDLCDLIRQVAEDFSQYEKCHDAASQYAGSGLGMLKVVEYCLSMR